MTIDLSKLPERLQRFISNNISKDEKILWSDQPIQSKVSVFRAASAYFIGLLFVIFPLILIYYGIKYHDARLVIGIISALVFYYIAYALFCWPNSFVTENKNTFYAVTTKRAIIIVPAKPFHIISVLPDEMQKYRIHSKEDGSGDVVLKEMFVSSVKGGYELSNAFMNLRNTHEAEFAIKELLKSGM